MRQGGGHDNICLDLVICAVVERGKAREHDVHCDAQRPHVAFQAVPAIQHLRGHVVHRPEGLRQSAAVQLGAEAEVAEFERVAVGMVREHVVLQLDVPVDNLPAMAAAARSWELSPHYAEWPLRALAAPLRMSPTFREWQ